MGVSGMSDPEQSRQFTLPRIADHDASATALLDRLGDATAFPLRILQAPRGYGKTALAVTWLRAQRGRVDIRFARLTTAANDRAGFWQEFLDCLEGRAPEVGGRTAPTSAATQERAIRMVAGLADPTLIVLDDYHEAGSQAGANEIDAVLVDLLRQNPQVFIMVAGRRPRALDSLGPLSVDAFIVGADDLRMTATMTAELARSIGLTLDRRGAERLTGELGGWPALVRAAIHQAILTDDPSTPPESFAGQYIAAAFHELASPALRDFALSTAVPSEFDLQTARALGSEEDAWAMISELTASGLLGATPAPSGSVYAYAPAVRRTLLGVMRQTSAELEPRAYRTLMQQAVRGDDPATALFYATQSRDWPAALEVIEACWDRLLLEAPDVLGAASRVLPAAKVSIDARLRMARDHLEPTGERRRRLHPYEPGGLSARLNASVIAGRGSNVRDDELLALLQWGVALLATGDLVTSAYAFAQAHTWATARKDGGSALAAVGAALAHALRGEPALAAPWLADPGLPAWRQTLDGEDHQDALLLALEAARALVLVDTDDAGAVPAALALADDPRRNDLSSLCVFIRAQAILQHGDEPAMLTHATNARAALDVTRRGSMAETYLAIVLVDLLLACEMPSSAREVLEFVEPRRDLRIALGRIHLAERRFGKALEDAEHVLRDQSPLGRYVLEAHLLAARAHDGAGRLPAAHAELRAAADLALIHGRTAPFGSMPPGRFMSLAGNDPSLQGLRPDLYRPDDGSGPRIVTLTPREAQVFHALLEHLGPVGIAQSLGLSPNTVKTHVRTIYRKLGVSSRADAIEQSNRVRIST
ncbi:hypothetical protein GCE65_02385 [Pseudactinotalea sp. HY158]|nr:hypothetical protein GCE65_02385 [Pseudactinotalea sp. HY158]